MTQRALAERAQISTNHYQDIACANANPTVIVLLRLANALGVPIVDLFDSPPPLPESRRVVPVEDLKELAVAHQRLTELVERLAADDVWPRPRRQRRASSRRHAEHAST